MIKHNKMKKETDFFEIDGVQYGEFTDKMDANQIRQELDFFRKSSRPSYMFVNALLTIQRLQVLVSDLRQTIDRKNKRIEQEQNYRVLYWFMFIIGLIVFGVGFRKIVEFLIDIIK